MLKKKHNIINSYYAKQKRLKHEPLSFSSCKLEKWYYIVINKWEDWFTLGPGKPSAPGNPLLPGDPYKADQLSVLTSHINSEINGTNLNVYEINERIEPSDPTLLKTNRIHCIWMFQPAIKIIFLVWPKSRTIQWTLDWHSKQIIREFMEMWEKGSTEQCKSKKLTYSLTNTTLRADRARVSTLSTLSLFTLGSNHSLGAWWTLES